MTRDELISMLEANGFGAKARDWAMGETVIVSRLEVALTDGITGLPGATHVWLSGSELVMLDPPGAELRFSSVESFLRALEDHFKAAEDRFRRTEAALESGAQVSGVIER